MAGFNFKKAAQNETSLCPLMAGREKLKTEDIVDQVLTVIAFDFAPKIGEDGERVIYPITGEVETFGVIVFAEYPNCYYGTGDIFTRVCRAWAAGFDTPEEASKALEESGGVRVKFYTKKSKKGRNMTAVDIVD